MSNTQIEECLMHSSYKFDGRVPYAIGAPVMSGWGDSALRRAPPVQSGEGGADAGFIQGSR
jgi:hypothetical protein